MHNFFNIIFYIYQFPCDTAVEEPFVQKLYSWPRMVLEGKQVPPALWNRSLPGLVAGQEQVNLGYSSSTEQVLGLPGQEYVKVKEKAGRCDLSTEVWFLDS